MEDTQQLSVPFESQPKGKASATTLPKLQLSQMKLDELRQKRKAPGKSVPGESRSIGSSTISASDLEDKDVVECQCGCSREDGAMVRIKLYL